MQFSKLSAVAATIATTSAFLIPTEISSSTVEIVKSLPFPDTISIESRVVDLPCPGCPTTAVKEGEMGITQAMDSKLQLKFSLEHDDESGDKLMMNKMQIYPLDLQAASSLEPLTAEQMVKGNDNTWTSAGSPVLGYSLSIKHLKSSSDKDDLNMVSIHIEIVEVADKFLSGLPSIDLKVLETPSHKLMIGAANIIAPATRISKPEGTTKECTTIACKWRAVIADRLAQIQALKAQALKKAGCGGKAKGQGHGRPMVIPTTPGFKHHGNHGEHEHSHHSGPDGQGRHFRNQHHHHSSVARFLRGIVMHVLIPVLVGVMVGITASLIGMVVGHIAIFLWRITFRRGQRSECRKQETASNETTDDEEKSFLGHQGPPPEYEIVIVDEKSEVV